MPVYLRCDGLVRNKKLTKKEVVAILREIWRDKISSDAQVSGPVFPSLMHDGLKQVKGSKDPAIILN